MANNKWFRIRKMGWTPCTWQGWTVIAFYAVAIFLTLDIEVPASRNLYGGLFTVGLIATAMFKTKLRSNRDE
jgi:hypothetical protein